MLTADGYLPNKCTYMVIKFSKLGEVGSQNDAMPP